MKERLLRREGGAIMLEAMIIVVLTSFLLLWIVGVGFLYYQRYLVRIVTTDAAEKIASTYYTPTTDVVMGFISVGRMKEREIYNSEELQAANATRADHYVRYELKQAVIPSMIKTVNVETELVDDSILGRSHVCITTTCTFDTPVGEALTYFGMDKIITYQVSGYADATNINDYASRVVLGKALTDGTFLSGTGVVEKVVKMVNSFIKMCVHLSS